MEGTYDLNLVALSIAIAIISSYTALDLAARLALTRGRLLYLWLFGGAFAMGAGIWSMHFVGMLAFHLPIPMGYDLKITILSLLIAVVVSACALWVMKGPELRQSLTLLGSILVGLGIASMHYTGMAAMRMSPPIDYDPLLVSASIGIAIIAAWVALQLAFRILCTHTFRVFLAKFGSAIVLGLGIAGMHYTGMAAANYAPGSVSLAADGGGGIDNLALAAIIALISIIILMVTLITAALDAHFAHENARLARKLKIANERLHELAMYDHLTKLPSRHLLNDRLQNAANRSDRSGNKFAYMMVDLDRFKPVNDKYGHRIGDEALKLVAERLLNCVRKEDTVARMGGDEFVIILNDISSEEDPVKVSKKIIHEISRPYQVENHELRISCSIGISIYPVDGTDLDALSNMSDKAMYQAKAEGGSSSSLAVPAEEKKPEEKSNRKKTAIK